MLNMTAPTLLDYLVVASLCIVYLCIGVLITVFVTATKKLGPAEGLEKMATVAMVVLWPIFVVGGVMFLFFAGIADLVNYLTVKLTKRKGNGKRTTDEPDA